MRNPYDLHIREALYEVYCKGFNRVEWVKFYRWFGRARLSDAIWDEVEHVWEEILENEKDEGGGRLGFLNWDSPTYLTLVYLDPENTKPQDSSFLPISFKRKSRKSQPKKRA